MLKKYFKNLFLLFVILLIPYWFLLGLIGFLVFIPFSIITLIALLIITVKIYYYEKHPLGFDFSNYDLTTIGVRVHNETNFIVFFAELLRLNNKKAIKIKFTEKKLEITKNKGNYFLTKYQNIIFQNIEKGTKNAYFEWEKELKKEKLKKLELTYEKSKLTKLFFQFIVFLLLSPFLMFFIFQITIILAGLKTAVAQHNKILNTTLTTQTYTQTTIKNQKKILKNTQIYSLIFFVFYFLILLLLSSFENTFAEILFLFWVLVPSIILYIYLIIIDKTNKILQSEKTFFGSYARELKNYSQLEETTKLSYYLMYGELGAWALALNIHNKKLNSEILKLNLN